MTKFSDSSNGLSSDVAERRPVPVEGPKAGFGTPYPGTYWIDFSATLPREGGGKTCAENIGPAILAWSAMYGLNMYSKWIEELRHFNLPLL